MVGSRKTGFQPPGTMPSHSSRYSSPSWRTRQCLSLIVSPAPNDTVAVAAAQEIWGWTWADGGVRRVDISTDDGATWRVAELEPARGREWQRFSIPWTPTHRGPAVLASRAQANGGLQQPPAGRRNAIHSVAVNVI